MISFDLVKDIVTVTGIIVGGIYIPYSNHIRVRREKIKKDAADAEVLKQREELTKVEKSIIGRVEGVELLIGDLIELTKKNERMILEHTSDGDILYKFKKAIRSKANAMVNSALNVQELEVYKTILLKWSDAIENYGLFYFDERAKSKEDTSDSSQLADNLRQNIEKIIRDFYINLDNLIPNIIVTEYNGKEVEHNFSKLLKETFIHRRTYSLTERLIENNITTEQVTSIFITYINDFFKLFLTSVDAWHLMITQKVKR